MNKKTDQVKQNIRAYIRGMKAAGQTSFTIRLTSDQMHLVFPEYGGRFDTRQPFKFDGYPVEII